MNWRNVTLNINFLEKAMKDGDDENWQKFIGKAKNKNPVLGNRETAVHLAAKFRPTEIFQLIILKV